MRCYKIKERLAYTISKLSPKMFFSIAYSHNRHKLPDFSHPKDLSEICIKRILDGKINKIYYLADKYKVRDYLESLGMGELLTSLIGVYNSPNDINVEGLPRRFALKINFGAGMNIICQDKSKFDISVEGPKLEGWLKKAGTYSFSEAHYNLITPKIICEEFIDDGSGHFPTDYKFMCLHGKAFCVLACSERDSDNPSYMPYSLDWTPRYDYVKGIHATNTIPKPANLGKMIEVAEMLSNGIDLVRVDLYSNGKKIWFGEMTLTPAGCIFHNWTQKALDDMGECYRNNSH